MEDNQMEKEQEFLELVANYCDMAAEDLTPDLRFREDLGFNSLSFMTFLGDLEDNFDIELDEEEALKFTTVGEALEYLNNQL